MRWFVRLLILLLSVLFLIPGTVLGELFHFSGLLDTSSETFTELETPQTLHANFVSWDTGCCHAVVCDPMENTFFHAGDELTVLFDEDTIFIDLDGSVLVYTPPKSPWDPGMEGPLHWVDGMVLEITFTAVADNAQDPDTPPAVIGQMIENVDVLVIDLD